MRLKIVIVLVLSTYDMGNLFAQDNVFNIQLLDKNDHAIQNCTILLNTTIVGSSNSGGYFSMPYPAKGSIVSIKHIAYKNKQIDVTEILDSMIIHLEDSSIPLKVVDIHPLKLNQGTLGNTRTKGYVNPYKLAWGGRLLGLLKINHPSFYLNSLHFFIKEINLPDSNSKVRVSIYNDEYGNIDSPEKKALLWTDTVVLSQENCAYNIKLDSLNHQYINSKELLIEFEPLGRPPLENRSTHIANNFIVFGTQQCNCGIISKNQGTYVDSTTYNMWPSNPISYPLKLSVDISFYEEEKH